MKILLTGGGSGGHITPLLAVARELKQLQPDIQLYSVCEKNTSFLHLYKNEPAIDGSYQISAGKYRRYSGLTKRERLTDVKTPLLNARDVGRTLKGYTEARKLLKKLRPDAILIKGGFVGVPVGKAAASLGIPYLTHDSDSIPGLANRLVAKRAAMHATGMPAEAYPYPPDKTVYTGIPIASAWQTVTSTDQQAFKEALGVGDCRYVIAVTGGSQGGSQLNDDMVTVTSRLMQRFEGIGILHIAGEGKVADVTAQYDGQLLADERRRVVVKGFVTDLHRYTGAADIVVSRASATTIAELAVQKKSVVLVPGRLAGAHQEKNAKVLTKSGKTLMADYGDVEGLLTHIVHLIEDEQFRSKMATALHTLAKPHAAQELALLTLRVANRQA